MEVEGACGVADGLGQGGRQVGIRLRGKCVL